MNNTADELEQDVEASRGRLDRTLGDLRARFQGPGVPRDLADLKRSGQAAGEAVERFAARLQTGHLIVLPGARHEILTECDAVRADFWAAFDAFMPGSDATEPTDTRVRQEA